MQRKSTGFLVATLVVAATEHAPLALCDPPATAAPTTAAPVAPTPVAATGIYQTQAPLKTPKKASERTDTAGADKVDVALWLPENAKVVRGVLINPFYAKAVEQEHWRAAARLWNFAVVGTNFFGVRDSDYPALLTALKDLGTQSGHPELENAPLCFVSFSAGSGMSMKFAQQMPERVIAVAPVGLEVGPRDEATRAIPTVTIFGEKDGQQMAILQKNLPEQRAAGARWATAVQWGRRHEFAWANNLVLPFFDRVIRQRYPAEQTPLQTVPKLLTLEENNGWLADGATWSSNAPEAKPFADYNGEKSAASWLPDAYCAAVWRAFVSKAPDIKITAPAGFGDGQPFSTLIPDNPIAITAEAKGEKKPLKVELFDGDKPLGQANAAPYAWNVKLEPGIHALIAVATYENGPQVSRPATVIVARL